MLPTNQLNAILRLLAVLWTLGIALALAWPHPDLPSPPSTLPLDKFVHVALFAGFGLLWMGALRPALRRRSAWVAGAGLLFAVATEAGQHVLPFGRAASGLDALADAAGLALGVGAFSLASRWRRSASPSPGQQPSRD